MYFQWLFEIALVIFAVYFIWRLVLRPKAEKFVRSKDQDGVAAGKESGSGNPSGRAGCDEGVEGSREGSGECTKGIG